MPLFITDSGEKYFAVDPVAGTLQLLKNLDYENITLFNLNVNVTDGNFTVSLKSTQQYNPILQIIT